MAEITFWFIDSNGLPKNGYTMVNIDDETAKNFYQSYKSFLEKGFPLGFEQSFKRQVILTNFSHVFQVDIKW